MRAVLYGVLRAALDLEVLIEAAPDNAQRLLKALGAAGLVTAKLGFIAPTTAVPASARRLEVAPAARGHANTYHDRVWTVVPGDPDQRRSWQALQVLRQIG